MSMGQKGGGSCLVYPVLIIFALLNAGHLFSQSIPDTARFADEINQFIEWDHRNSFPEQAFLFIGSSSIRLWMTHDYFPEYPVINRGFGGSQISDVTNYLEHTVLKYGPSVIIFYAGDNDIAAGKTAETVTADFINFITTVRQQVPAVRIIYLPVKLSPSRRVFWGEMKSANEEIKNLTARYDFLTYVDTASPMMGRDGEPRMELYAADSLHLSEKGYSLWSAILLPYLKASMNED